MTYQEYVWTRREDDLLTDYLFDTNLSPREIAIELGTTEPEVRRRIRDLSLGWVQKSKGQASRGQSALTAIMRKLLPGEEIVTEEHIGHRLRLDVYCPKYKLAAEFHGRQHFEYVRHFHGDIYGFREAQERDEKKLQICQDLGIALVVFRYNDVLTENIVYRRLLEALRSSLDKEHGVIEDTPAKVKDPYHEANLQRQREYRRMQYRKMKKQRGERKAI